MDALETTGVFSSAADTNPSTIDKNAGDALQWLWMISLVQ
jgi:hypothetical protein